MKQRFEMVDGASRKFWEISREGNSLHIRFGRIGTDGQAQTKDFASPEKASAAADKLIQEKTAKGYAEVSGAERHEAPKSAREAQKEPAEAAPKAAGKGKARGSKSTGSSGEAAGAGGGKASKAEAKKLEALGLSGGKQAGERALLNGAERLKAAKTPEEWHAALDKLPGGSWEREKVLAYLLQHGAFVPVERVHALAVAKVLATLATGDALRVISQIPEAAVQTPPRGTHPGLQYVPLLRQLQQADPDAFRATTMAPSLARIALLLRAIGGESVAEAEVSTVLEVAAGLLVYGDTAIGEYDEYRHARALDPRLLAGTFERIAGPHWIRTFPDPERLPTAVAIQGLAGESLEEAARVVGLFNKGLLAPRTEAPARFFEVAAKHTGQKAEYLRVAGVARAQTPDEIPEGAELAIEPDHVMTEHGFAQLGTARLDAWARHWIARNAEDKAAQEPEFSEGHLDLVLLRLALKALPFGDTTRAELLPGPLPYEHSSSIDVHSWVSEISSVDSEGALDVARVAAAKARALEAEGAHPDRVRGFRLLVASALRRAPEGAEIPETLDDLLSLGDGTDHDSERLVREAVEQLPVARAERVMLRTAHELRNPYEELTYAREGLSEVMIRRMARLVASGRESDRLWMDIRNGALVPLGASFGGALLDALGNATISASFLDNLASCIHEEALDVVRKGTKKKLLDLPRELARLARELGGESAVVYALRTGAAARGLARVGGVPAGFSPEEIPRHRGRKMVHAFTVDLKQVPELAARYPGARTLSVWIQGYSESPHRAQALVPRTDAQIAAHPASGEAEALVIERLEVPAAMFSDDENERARYASGLLYKEPGFLLGGPLWLQTGPRGLDAKFVAQYDERLAPGANFGDAGICYSFADRAEWQCH